MTACLHIMKGDEDGIVWCILLGIDPGENSLSLPLPGWRLQKQATGEPRRGLPRVDGLGKSHCDSVNPRDGDEDSREGLLC